MKREKMNMTITKNKNIVLLAFGIILIVLAIGGTLGFYYMAPSSYLALDVNPSIEIHTNRLNQVTSVNPVNEDAKKIMAGYQLTDKNIETVIKNIVDRMILNGFIAPDKDNQILITTGEDQNASELSKTVNTIVETYLTEKQVDANLIPQSIKITSKSMEEAHRNHVSAGKMAIIQKLVENDSTLTVKQLIRERISDLVDLAVSKNISLDGIKYKHAAQITSANTPTPGGTTNNVQVTGQAVNSIIEEEDSDKNDDIEEQSNDINEVKKMEHKDIKKHKNSHKEDKNSYLKDNEFEDQSDNDIEDQDVNEDQEDSDLEDQNEKQNDSVKKLHQDYQINDNNEDQYVNENDNEKSDYEYEQNDNKNDDQEDAQRHSEKEDHTDDQNMNHESED
jgi:AAA ATPase containing von Willebrand factor type A (vWA) domain